MQANTTAVQEVGTLRLQAAEAVAKARLWKEIRTQVRPYDWAAGVDGVLGQVPEGVRVREVTFSRGLLRLTGDAVSTDLVHELVRRLNRLPSVEEANIERLIRNPAMTGQLPGYTVTCRFREPAPPVSAAPSAPAAPALRPTGEEAQPRDP
jgi:hypothetical protein